MRGAIVFALIACLAPSVALADSTALLQPGESLFRAIGQGSVQTIPDRVTFQTSVTTDGATPAEAVSGTGERLDGLITAVRRLGIQGLNITTNRVVVNPIESERDDDSDGIPRAADLHRYRSRNTLTITLPQTDRVSEVMAALIEAGATGLDGPNFELTNPAASRIAAERLAIENARETAERQAAQLGLKVSRVVAISYSGSSNYDVADIIVTGSSIRAGVRIEPSTVETSETIYVDFALIPR